MKGRWRTGTAITLALFGFSIAAAQTGVRVSKKEHRPIVEIRRMLEPVAAEYPGPFLAAVYSIPELRPDFLATVKEGSPDPWSHRSLGTFDLRTSEQQKKKIILDLARRLEKYSIVECDSTVRVLRWWCETERIFDLMGPTFAGFYAADATKSIFDGLDPSRRLSPELVESTLASAERATYYKDVLTRVARLGPTERLRFFSQLFAYMAEHPRGWGD